MRRSLLLGVFFTALLAGSALAEVEPIVPRGGQYLGSLTLPKLPKVIGWMPNPSASLLQRARVLLPPGKSLDDTDAMISGVAYAQSALPQAPSLDAFIVLVQASDQQTDPGRTAVETTPLTDKAGRHMRVFTFKSADGAPGEVAYGMETSGGTGYYTAFTLSALNAMTLTNSLASFRDMIANYQ